MSTPLCFSGIFLSVDSNIWPTFPCRCSECSVFAVFPMFPMHQVIQTLNCGLCSGIYPFSHAFLNGLIFLTPVLDLWSAFWPES